MRHRSRWLSLLAALVLALMPTAAALGEANPGHEWTMRWQWNEELIASTLEEIPEETDETTLAMMRMMTVAPWQILNAMSMRVQLSENMQQVRYSMDMSDQPIWDMEMHQTGSRVDCIASMLPGIVLSYPTADAQEAQEAWERLSRMDLNVLLASLLQELTAWADTVDFQEEVLTGEAFIAPQAEMLIRWSFDDRDLAVLLDSLAEALRGQPMLQEWLLAVYGEDFLSQLGAMFQEMNRAAARENVYGYQLALLLDDEERVIGAELSGGARLDAYPWQLMLGWTETDVQAVLILPAQQEEEADLLMRLLLEDEGQTVTLEMAEGTGLPLEEALQEHAFLAYIGQNSQTQTAEEVQKMHEGTLAIREDGEEEIIQVLGELNGDASMSNWEGILTLTLPKYAEEPLCTLMVTQDYLPHMEWTDTSDRERVELADPMTGADAWMESILQAQDILEPVVEQGTKELTVRLFKALPPELFSQLFQAIPAWEFLQE